MDDKEGYRILNSLDEFEDEFTILEKTFQDFPDKLNIKWMTQTVPYPYKIIGKHNFANEIAEKYNITDNRYKIKLDKFIPYFLEFYKKHSKMYPRILIWTLNDIRLDLEKDLEGYIQQYVEDDPDCIDEGFEVEDFFFRKRDDLGYIMNGIDYMNHEDDIPIYDRFLEKMNRFDSDLVKHLPHIHRFYLKNKRSFYGRDSNYFPSNFVWRIKLNNSTKQEI